jgi:hypothetical protein
VTRRHGLLKEHTPVAQLDIFGTENIVNIVQNTLSVPKPSSITARVVQVVLPLGRVMTPNAT